MRRSYRFYGRVQGVGFRYFCREAALSCGARGWVLNNPDGSVEMEAESSAEVLDRLVRLVRGGHPAARVDRMDERDVAPLNDLREGFYIRY